jgi:hypothetical protein
MLHDNRTKINSISLYFCRSGAVLGTVSNILKTMLHFEKFLVPTMTEIKIRTVKIFYVRWVSCHHSMAPLQVAEGGNASRYVG